MHNSGSPHPRFFSKHPSPGRSPSLSFGSEHTLVTPCGVRWCEQGRRSGPGKGRRFPVSFRVSQGCGGGRRCVTATQVSAPRTPLGLPPLNLHSHAGRGHGPRPPPAKRKRREQEVSVTDCDARQSAVRFHHLHRAPRLLNWSVRASEASSGAVNYSECEKARIGASPWKRSLKRSDVGAGSVAGELCRRAGGRRSQTRPLPTRRIVCPERALSGRNSGLREDEQAEIEWLWVH